MKRVQWFDAQRRLSDDVAEFMRCYVWRTELKLRYGKKIEGCKQSLENLKNLEGSIFADKIPEQREQYLARIAELEQELADEIERSAKFELSDEGKELRKALKKNPAAADLAIYSFFKAYGLDVLNTQLIDEILNAAGEKIDNKTLVNTRGAVATAFDSTRCLKMVFVKAYEHMVCVGKIKPVQIPDLMMDKYDAARVKARKDAKKAAKKNSK